MSPTIHDLAGRVVRHLSDGVPERPGIHRVAWAGTDDAGRPLASGLHFVTVETQDRADRLRLIRLE